MHVRTVSTTRNGKTYRYTQLVQSYRRASDGKPAHKVLANLGRLSQVEIDNLKTALNASRAGQSVVFAEALASRLDPDPVAANLRYLDLAVALQLWRQWHLPQLLEELFGTSQTQLPPANIVAALVLQRCIAPGSKLFAQRWLPTTTLPELLGIAPAQFNNSRLHRLLFELDEITPKLQARLPSLYQARHGAFTTLFADVTDTWFVGQGPHLAETGLTKEGLFKRKIGIVLLCNQHGYPLRWEVVPGKRADTLCIAQMVQTLASLDWATQAPLVCDRALGQDRSVLEFLLQSDLRFLTALPSNQIDSYSPQLPHQPFASLKLGCNRQSFQSDVRLATTTAVEAGLEKADGPFFVLDLGRVALPSTEAGKAPLPVSGQLCTGPLSMAQAMTQAKELEKMLASARVATQAEAGKLLGLSSNQVARRMALLRLSSSIQKVLLLGQAEALSLKKLDAISRHQPSDKQWEAFNQALQRQSSETVPSQASTPSAVPPPPSLEPPPPMVRLVAVFNPQRFVKQRQKHHEHLSQIHAFVHELNQRLARPKCQLDEVAIHQQLRGKLRRRGLLQAFDIQVQRLSPQVGKDRLEVRLHAKPHVLTRRSRYDGFVVLVAHGDLHHSARELGQLYRAKDKVEKDFQAIKGVIRLRPVRHRTDPKVRAHVTLCMLALLLERSLEELLAATVLRQSAAAAFETLSTCHLNRYRVPRAQEPLYSITDCTEQQRALLQALGMVDLVDTQRLCQEMTLRKGG